MKLIQVTEYVPDEGDLYFAKLQLQKNKIKIYKKSKMRFFNGKKIKHTALFRELTPALRAILL